MASVNKVILLGNLGRDPEVRNLPNGGKVVNLSVATSESWRDKASGERKEKTEWHRVVIFNEGLAEVAEKYLSKGRTVYLEGGLQTRKWTDQSGAEKYSTEIVLGRFDGKLVLLGGDKQGGANEAGTPAQSSQGRAAPRRNPDDDLDDDIPFAWAGLLIGPALALLSLGGLA